MLERRLITVWGTGSFEFKQLECKDYQAPTIPGKRYPREPGIFFAPDIDEWGQGRSDLWTVAIDTANVHGAHTTSRLFTTTAELDTFVRALKEIATS